jgi:hypothetical protein
MQGHSEQDRVAYVQVVQEQVRQHMATVRGGSLWQLLSELREIPELLESGASKESRQHLTSIKAPLQPPSGRHHGHQFFRGQAADLRYVQDC